MPAPKSPEIARIRSMPFDENTYIIHLGAQRDCWVIDPGLEPGKILQYLEEHQLAPAAILNTHGHSDHIAGNATLKEKWPDCPLVIGEGDAYKLTDPEANLSAQFGLSLISPEADSTVVEGDVYSSAGLTLRVLETPGHSAGHVVFVLDTDANESVETTILIGGDMLFRQGIGRTDFPDGDPVAMERSIREKLYTLPNDTIVYPGHGEPTTIGFEREHNPFVPG